MNNYKDNYMNMVNIISLVLGMMNLQENLTQGDKQDIIDDLNKKSELLLNEIHQHLKKQDEKIDLILKKIENIK